jgi:hypothetical protein
MPINWNDRGCKRGCRGISCNHSSGDGKGVLCHSSARSDPPTPCAQNNGVTPSFYPDADVRMGHTSDVEGRKTKGGQEQNRGLSDQNYMM